MKHLLILILFVPLVFSCGKNEIKYSDMAEYGIKGRPKQIKSFIYDKTEVVDGNRVPVDDSGYVTFYQLTIDENGFITDNYTRFTPNPGDWIHTLVEYEFENGRKSSAKTYNNKHELTGKLNFIWYDDHNYEEKRYNDKGKLISVNKYKLNSEFREISGEYTLYESSSGKMLYSNSFENVLSHEGEIIGISEVDKESNEETRIVFKRSDHDEYRNPLKTEIYNEGETEPKRIVKRRIIYH